MVCGLLLLPVAALGSDLPAVKLYTETAGVHRVSWEDLEAAGLQGSEVDSRELALRHSDRLVRLRVVDGGDGKFGPGDFFEFVATVLPGRTTYYHPHSPLNVYWLEWDATRARRYRHREPASAGAVGASLVEPERRIHLEEDKLLIRLAAKDIEPREDPELWYWAKLSHRSKQPFAVELDVPGARAIGPWTIRIGVRGLSTGSTVFEESARLTDHKIDIRFDDLRVSTVAWDGKAPYLAKRSGLRRAGGASDLARIEVEVVPQRNEEERLIDVVMIDWVEAEFQVDPRLLQPHVQWWIPPGQEGGLLTVTPEEAGKVGVFGEGYWEWPAAGRDRRRPPQRSASLREAGRLPDHRAFLVGRSLGGARTVASRSRPHRRSSRRSRCVR